MRIGRFHFGYNATEDKGRRQSPKTTVYHESEVLTPPKRRKLQSTAQDQMRNHSLVAWMVRKHLDYVSKFHISFRTGNPELDAVVNRIFRWHGKPRNLDYLGRFGRDEMFRLYEMEKVLAGDAALLKLDDLKLQAIESDLIAKGRLPEQPAPELKAQWDKINSSGLVVDDTGRVMQYAISQRGMNGTPPTFDHLEPVENVIFDGYWTRLSSQFRGVSPLSTAINMVQDLHEGFEFNQIKGKMHALFGVAITRDAQGDGNLGPASGAEPTRAWAAEAYTWTAGDYCTNGGILYGCNTTHTTTAESVFATDKTAGKWTEDSTGSGMDLDPRTVNILDLEAGAKAETIESKTPSTEFVAGSYLFIQIAMLALDIPVTAFDSRRSSFSARIADLNEYEVSSDSKRTKNRYVRQEYSDWVLAEIWNGAADAWGLKSAAGQMALEDVQEAVEWIPSGSPWLDKKKQIEGDQLGISIALDNAIDASRRRGVDVFDNIDKQAKVIAYAKLRGVPLTAAKSGDQTIGDKEDAGQDAEPGAVPEE